MDGEVANQSTVPKKGPNDFIFGRVLGDGSFSTVSNTIITFFSKLFKKISFTMYSRFIWLKILKQTKSLQVSADRFFLVLKLNPTFGFSQSV